MHVNTRISEHLCTCIHKGHNSKTIQLNLLEIIPNHTVPYRAVRHGCYNHAKHARYSMVQLCAVHKAIVIMLNHTIYLTWFCMSCERSISIYFTL